MGLLLKVPQLVRRLSVWLLTQVFIQRAGGEALIIGTVAAIITTKQITIVIDLAAIEVSSFCSVPFGQRPLVAILAAQTKPAIMKFDLPVTTAVAADICELRAYPFPGDDQLVRRSTTGAGLYVIGHGHRRV